MALNPAILAQLIVDELSEQGFEVANEFCFASKLATALANAVVMHIKTDSELLAITRDSGAAGAGIITGKVA